MMQYVSIYTLVLGKLLNGFFVTVAHIAAVKMINETVPLDLIGSYATIYSIGGAAGYLCVFGLGIILPSNDYNPADSLSELNQEAKAMDVADNMWRIVYMFPAMMNLYMLAVFYSCI